MALYARPTCRVWQDSVDVDSAVGNASTEARRFAMEIHVRDAILRWRGDYPIRLSDPTSIGGIHKEWIGARFNDLLGSPIHAFHMISYLLSRAGIPRDIHPPVVTEIRSVASLLACQPANIGRPTIHMVVEIDLAMSEHEGEERCSFNNAVKNLAPPRKEEEEEEDEESMRSSFHDEAKVSMTAIRKLMPEAVDPTHVCIICFSSI